MASNHGDSGAGDRSGSGEGGSGEGGSGEGGSDETDAIGPPSGRRERMRADRGGIDERAAPTASLDGLTHRSVMGDLDGIEPAWRTLKRKWEHSFHPMCSYMGMFPASLPHYFVRKLTDEGDVVLDPFSGRGTTALQACVDGRVGIGNDLNPMAYVLTRAKVNPPPSAAVAERLDELSAAYTRPPMDDVPDRIRMLYHERTLGHLVYLKREFGLGEQGVPEDLHALSDVDNFIAAMLLGVMHGQSDAYLSVPMPNTFSMSENYLGNYIEEEGLEVPDRDVFQKLLERLRTVYSDGRPERRGHAVYGDVRDLPEALAEIDDAGGDVGDGVDLLFTSPPYLKVLKYGLYNWIRLWFLDEEPDVVDERLDDELDLAEYLEFMTDTLRVADEVLDDETGVAAFVIGDVDQGDEVINLAREVADAVVEPMDGFEVGGIVEDRVPDNEKVSRIWGETKGEATEIDRILIAHRGELTIKEDPDGLKTKTVRGTQETLGSFG
ncbi:DNA methyltransferase [Halorubrum tibetense]|uniref:site-specific DNA-methyltransferase (cytosine-N(4)-specific) n=1 Tax=Halorubrum tibetense TaxID=175631 RepID=A0ABD5SFG8_9EURY